MRALARDPAQSRVQVVDGIQSPERLRAAGPVILRFNARRQITRLEGAHREGAAAEVARGVREHPLPRLAHLRSTAALVHAPSVASALGLSSKLQHYGKYGILAFEGEALGNVEKKTWRKK